MIDEIKKIKNEDINLKLRTLNLIRWIAIFGQFAAVIIAYFYLMLVAYSLLLHLPDTWVLAGHLDDGASFWMMDHPYG